MTLAQFLIALAARLASIDARITELSTMQGMSPEQAVQLAQAVADVALLKSAIESVSQGVVSTQAQVADVTRVLQAAATSQSAMRAEVDELRAEITTLKSSVGDLSSLPAI